MQLRRVCRMPRIAAEIARGNLIGEVAAQSAELCDVEIEMNGLERLEVLQREVEKTHGRAKAPAIFRMIRAKKLFLQMDEGAGGLDQSFEKRMVLVALLEPEMFEHIVRFVVLPRIEAAEEPLITGVQRAGGIGAEGAHKVADAFRFFHRVAKRSTARRWCPAFFRRAVCRRRIASEPVHA
jgi:hypothetical protein